MYIIMKKNHLDSEDFQLSHTHALLSERNYIDGINMII